MWLNNPYTTTSSNRCNDPPSLDNLAAFVLTGDPGRKNGSKILRAKVGHRLRDRSLPPAALFTSSQAGESVSQAVRWPVLASGGPLTGLQSSPLATTDCSVRAVARPQAASRNGATANSSRTNNRRQSFAVSPHVMVDPPAGRVLPRRTAANAARPTAPGLLPGCARRADPISARLFFGSVLTHVIAQARAVGAQGYTRLAQALLTGCSNTMDTGAPAATRAGGS